MLFKDSLSLERVFGFQQTHEGLGTVYSIVDKNKSVIVARHIERTFTSIFICNL